MSFGWSAGDIAAAIALLCKVIQALDTADGAAHRYRDAVGFLRDLKRTLEPLQRIVNLEAHSTYGLEIAEQVKQIRGPVEDFLEKTVEYEPSLGKKAVGGHHRHVLKKLKWFVWQEKRAVALKEEIESHMRIIDTLMQLLILDATLSIQKNLPEQLRAAFTELLPVELLEYLRTTLLPLHKDIFTSCQLQQKGQIAIALNLKAQNTWLSADITAIKKNLKEIQSTLCLNRNQMNAHLLRDEGMRLKELAITSKNSQRSLGLCDTDRAVRPAMNSAPSKTYSQVEIDQKDLAKINRALKSVLRQAFRELYSFMLMYTIYILQLFIKAVARLKIPSRAIIQVLLAKHNISFFDAVGSPPRILPYEFFHSFRVCQAFIQEHSRRLPGSSLVRRGDFVLITTALDRPLAEKTWNRFVAPGASIFMAMLLREQVHAFTDGTIETCPYLECSGQWKRSAKFSGEMVSWILNYWVNRLIKSYRSPVCEKEFLSPNTDDSNQESEDECEEEEEESDDKSTDSGNDSDDSNTTVTQRNLISLRAREIDRPPNREAGTILY